MKKYIKVFLALLRINFYNHLTYRVNLLTSILGSLGWTFLGITTTFIITSKISSAYGWTRGELLLLASVYPIYIALFYMFFSNSLGEIPDIVNRGDLDTYVNKPIDSQFLVSIRRMDFVQIVRVISGIILATCIIHVYHVPVTPISFFVAIILIFFGFILLYSVWFSVMTISLWFTTLSNLKDFLYYTNGILRYPIDIFLKPKNVFLDFLAIFAVGLSIPLKALFGKLPLYELAILLSLSLGWFLFARWFWRFALRSYTSASS